MRAWPSLMIATATLCFAEPARAIGIGSNDLAVQIREDFVLVVVDEHRQHLVYAARLEPAAPRLVLIQPTADRAEVAPLSALDLPLAFHTLVARYEARALGRAGAPTAPWLLRGSRATARALRADEADGLALDRGWQAQLVQAHSWLAAIEVTAPDDGRLEMLTPPVRISFRAATPGLHRREPVTARRASDPASASEAAREPYRVEDVRTAPEPEAPRSETVERVLRTRSTPVRTCYDAFLAARPGTPARVDFQVVVSRRGETVSVVDARKDASRAGSGGPSGGERPAVDAEAERALAECVTSAVRKKSFPRIDREWRFSAALAFVPPPVPPRRTHVLLLGRARLRWATPPQGVTLVRELEPEAIDVAQALPAELRRVLGLEGADRFWVSEYLDTNDRRQDAGDMTITRDPIPSPGAPGTTAFADAKAATGKPDARHALRRPPGKGLGRVMAATLASVVAAAAVALAILLGRRA